MKEALLAKHALLAGTTSWIDYVRVTDMNGSPITGLVFNSTGLLSKYVLSGAASVAITLATQTVTGAYSSGGFVEIDATAFPGLYRLDVPNAALASGNKSYVSLYGYSGMNVSMLEYDLVAYNPQDAVRLGLTSLPNAAAEASGGLYTRGTGAGQINQPANGMIDGNVVRWLGTAVSTPTVAGVPNVNTKTWNDLTTVALPLIPTTAGRTLDVASTGEAGLDFDNIKAASGATTLTNIRVPNVTLADTVTTYTGNTVQTGDSFARLGAAGAGLTALGDTRIANLDATISSRTKPADTQAAVTLVSTLTTYTGNTPQTGDSYARIGAPAVSVSADIAAVKADTAAVKIKTDNLPSDPADASDVAGSFTTVNATLATIAGYIDTEVAAIKAKTDLIPAAPAAVADIPTANANADALLDRTAGVETGITLRQAQRVQLAAAAGKLSGAATTTVKLRNNADTKDRVTATVDSDGNRSAITLDLT